MTETQIIEAVGKLDEFQKLRLYMRFYIRYLGLNALLPEEMKHPIPSEEWFLNPASRWHYHGLQGIHREYQLQHWNEEEIINEFNRAK